MLRQVNLSYRADYDYLMGSGLYEQLQLNRLIIPHSEIDTERAASPTCVYKVIQPQQLPFVSYPYEWCFSQLKDAALVTLKIQQEALSNGMILKDASAYNIQFLNGRPLLIDTLSLQRYQPGTAWTAYRQFCQHFLAPLTLMAFCDPRLLQLWRSHVDGIPLDLVVKLLPWHARLRIRLLLHLYVQVQAQKRWIAVEDRLRSDTRNRFSIESLSNLAKDLERTVEGISFVDTTSTWSSYYESEASYTVDALAAKKKIVAEYVSQVQPLTAWDLGANTGYFTDIVNKAAPKCQTVAWDYDMGCVEMMYRRVCESSASRLLPLVLDLTNPTPALGFAGNERMSLVERGPVDLVLMLAVIHHVAITYNVPFDRMAAWLASLCRWLIIEFVPKDDPQVQRLLRSRDDIFEGYHEHLFEKAFSCYFTQVRKDILPNSSRKLVLLRSCYHGV